MMPILLSRLCFVLVVPTHFSLLILPNHFSSTVFLSLRLLQCHKIHTSLKACSLDSFQMQRMTMFPYSKFISLIHRQLKRRSWGWKLLGCFFQVLRQPLLCRTLAHTFNILTGTPPLWSATAPAVYHGTICACAHVSVHMYLRAHLSPCSFALLLPHCMYHWTFTLFQSSVFTLSSPVHVPRDCQLLLRKYPVAFNPSIAPTANSWKIQK